MFDNQHAYALEPGSQLQEFKIISVLGSGGFGITYKALDTSLSTQDLQILVAIKEYFPRDHVVREHGRATVVPHSPKDQTFYDYGFKSFQEEARTLARFPEHPNIVQIKRYFTANSTAYMVMPYLEGQTFGQWLASHPQPTQQQLLDIFIPVLDGLRAVHSENYLHRDIKPGNIYIRSDGRPLLIDFGAARLALGEHSKSLSVVLSEGYAAKEQYSKRGKQGPWTDIYGIGASLWRAISGNEPEPATDRSEARDDGLPDPLHPAAEVGKGRYSDNFLQAIDWALAYMPQERPQTVKELQDMLLQEWSRQQEPPQSTPVTSPPIQKTPEIITRQEPLRSIAPQPVISFPGNPPEQTSDRRSNKPLWLGAGLLVLTLVGGGSYWLGQSKPVDIPEETTTISSSDSILLIPPATQPVAPPPRLPFEPEMVSIPAGTFTMGCDSSRDDVEGGCDSDEKPAHEVTIDAFQMAKTEITVGQYMVCVDVGECPTPEWREKGSTYNVKTGADDHYKKLGVALDNPNHPIVGVSWNNAQKYAKWLSSETGKDYRLPTEAEWEYAARGGSDTAYPWGNAIGKGNANCDSGCGDSFDYTSPVGSFAANSYGLYDMNGNAWEWVQDRWHGDYNGVPVDGSAWESGDSAHRVLRGGSWLKTSGYVRSAYRYSHTPDDRYINIGFRLASG